MDMREGHSLPPSVILCGFLGHMVPGHRPTRHVLYARRVGIINGMATGAGVEHFAPFVMKMRLAQQRLPVTHF